MTDTTATVAPLDTDPRPRFQVALATAADTVAGVRAGQLDDPTPCAAFDVRALIQHLLGVVDRITAIGRGDDPFAPPLREVDEAWVATWWDAEAALQLVWADDAALDVPSPLPWTPGTGADVLRGYLGELTVHSWDLATATGQQPAWDGEVLRAVVDDLAGGLPAEGRAAIFAQMRAQLPPHLADLPDPFQDAVPVGEDAPFIDRIVAWHGRRP